MRRSAFSLVELLVVMAIISTLAALLLPSLAQSIESSRQITCLNNQRQIGTAFRFYADEYNDYLIPQWRGIPLLYPAWHVLATPYLGGDAIFKACPSPKDEASHACRGLQYGYNYYYLGAVTYGTPTIVKVPQVAHPAQTILVTDSRGNWDGWGSQIVQRVGFVSIAAGIAAATPTEMMDDRHGGCAGIQYVDGHTALLDWVIANKNLDLWDRK